MNTVKLSLLFALAAIGSTTAMEGDQSNLEEPQSNNGITAKMCSCAHAASSYAGDYANRANDYIADKTRFNLRQSLGSFTRAKQVPRTALLSGLAMLGITNAADKSKSAVFKSILDVLKKASKNGVKSTLSLIKPAAQRIFSIPKLKKAAPVVIACGVISAIYYGITSKNTSVDADTEEKSKDATEDEAEGQDQDEDEEQAEGQAEAKSTPQNDESATFETENQD